MSEPLDPDDRAAVLAYVTAHETENVRQYVESLYEEEDELRPELGSIRRRGMSPDGRAALIRVVRVIVVIGVLALVYVLGRASVQLNP